MEVITGMTHQSVETNRGTTGVRHLWIGSSFWGGESIKSGCFLSRLSKKTWVLLWHFVRRFVITLWSRTYFWLQDENRSFHKMEENEYKERKCKRNFFLYAIFFFYLIVKNLPLWQRQGFVNSSLYFQPWKSNWCYKSDKLTSLDSFSHHQKTGQAGSPPRTRSGRHHIQTGSDYGETGITWQPSREWGAGEKQPVWVVKWKYTHLSILKCKWIPGLIIVRYCEMFLPRRWKQRQTGGRGLMWMEIGRMRSRKQEFRPSLIVSRGTHPAL